MPQFGGVTRVWLRGGKLCFRFFSLRGSFVAMAVASPDLCDNLSEIMRKIGIGTQSEFLSSWLRGDLVFWFLA
jgi:hypothetical protein